MWRVLNLSTPLHEDERWKLYKELLQRYLYFVREAKKRLRIDSRNDTYNDTNVAVKADDDGAEDKQDKDIDMLSDDELEEIRNYENISISNDNITVAEISSGKKRAQSAEKIKEILGSVPQTYRSKANALLKYLLNIPPTKISWDKRGVVTIDGNVVAGSNISELINDTIRERKTVKAVGRIQFAQLLHDIGTPSNLIGNRDLTTAARRSLRIKKNIATRKLHSENFSNAFKIIRAELEQSRKRSVFIHLRRQRR